MRITNIEIHNFRGIRESVISFPLKSRIICLIGSGDSTKSTLLKAIEWAFWPTWNLVASDADFYCGDFTQPIIIRISFAEFPEAFMSEDKFGLYLRQPYAIFHEDVDDEPSDDLPPCLTIQLTIDASLEPKWEIICNCLEPRVISHIDRKQLFIGVISDNASKDMAWGRYSVLQKYADSKGVFHETYTHAIREVTKKADLSSLDSVSATLVEIGNKYGISFDTEIRNRLLFQGNYYSSTVGLYDGDAPLSQLGKGSQRLLSMGLNIGAAPGNAVLLIDEIENGLEPYRLRNLINEFRSEHGMSGQIIMTTHSPVVVAECSIDELMVVHSEEGGSKAFYLKGDDSEVNNAIQKEIRRNAEALLCKRLIVCEGKTEMGFVRAIDSYIARKQNYRMAFKGVGTADGNGSNVFKCADILRKCGYDICILMDSDKSSEENDKQRMRLSGVSVFDWDQPNAFEEQCFSELSLEALQAELQVAIDEKGADSITSVLHDNNIPFSRDGEKVKIDVLSKEQRKALGKIAKDKGWYKRIGLGEQFGNIVLNDLDNFAADSAIKKVIMGLSEWVMSHDKRRA